MEGLKVFDKEECGKILAAELRHILLALGERLNVEEADELLKGVEDAEGLVNYEGKFPLPKRLLCYYFCTTTVFSFHQEGHGRSLPPGLSV